MVSCIESVGKPKKSKVELSLTERREQKVIIFFSLFDFSYAVCIHPVEGYCCVEYQQCSDTNSFSLSHVDAAKAMQDELCSEDYVEIDG